MKETRVLGCGVLDLQHNVWCTGLELDSNLDHSRCAVVLP